MAARRASEAERQLTARMARGDRDAFASVFDEHVDELRSFARDLGPSRIDAVLHEAFLALWRQAPRLDPSVPIRDQLLALVLLHGRPEPIAA
ncbi:RNA polymerase sigma factor [Arenivirga flava]|uniref:RNA polymerase sigma-70 region 2 domain-containing protein n=1 Tax=Arenivirga flava TaxID=1930060 RepID=A0AA37UQW2_9MICO|nr:hypothetical protein [Arenivirga flava]GMA27187.1 hypothetical protein GCM10025874_04400 [Arenivirga flava]